MGLPHQFKHITLHLARSHAFPDGSSRHGYDIVAPLGPDDRIDAHAWRERREACRVRRFWAGEPDKVGHLVHRPGGAGGHGWIIDYDPTREIDDEAAFRFADHALRTGEYVSIRDDAGVLHTFRVVAVDAAA